MKNKIQQIKKNPSFLYPISGVEIKRTVTKKLVSPNHLNQFKPNFLRNSQLIRFKKEPKDTQTLLSPTKNNNINNTNNTNVMSSKDLLFKTHFLNKLENKNKILTLDSVDNPYFFKIRKEIYKNFKNRYRGPYMEHLIRKGYYRNKEKEDYPIYYNYYQIYHLMNKKKFALTIKYNEFVLFYDEQEYLIKYLGNNEQYIIMNYLMNFVYDKDKCVNAYSHQSKILKKDQIKSMFSQLVQNNYLFDGTMEILDNIGVYFRMSFSNTGKNNILLEKVKPVINTKINYLYIKDVPKKLVPNIMPNIFPVLKKKIKYLIIYLKSIKYNQKRTFENFEEEKNIKEIELNPNTKNINNLKIINSSSNESNKLDDNFLENISSTPSKEESKSNIIYKEQKLNNYNSNRRFQNENGIHDIELLLDKFEPQIQRNEYPRKKTKPPTIKENTNFNFNKEIKRNSLSIKEYENNEIYEIKENNYIDNNIVQNKKYVNEENSLIDNKNNIINNNAKLFKKITKKEIFKTSLKGRDSIFNKNKNNKNKLSTKAVSTQLSKNSYKNNTTNKHIYSRQRQLHLKLNSKNKYINSYNNSLFPSFLSKNTFLKKSHSDLTKTDILYLNSLKNRDISSNKTQKNNKRKISGDYFTDKGKTTISNMRFSSAENTINLDNSIPINNSNIDYNNNNFYFKDILTNNLISQKKISQDFKNTYKNSIKRNNFKIRKYPTLKQFELIYEKIKEMGLLPKAKSYYKGKKIRISNNFTGNSLFENKIYNEWEEKGGEKSIMSEYYLSTLKKKIKEENKKNDYLSKNFYTMKDIRKCPNIYY